MHQSGKENLALEPLNRLLHNDFRDSVEMERNEIQLEWFFLERSGAKRQLTEHRR